MSGLTKEFLSEIGVHMDDLHFALFSEHLDETIYERIEDDVIHALGPERVHELAQLRTSGGEDVWSWLQTNVPTLGDIIRAEVDAVLTEVVRNSDHL